MTPPPPQSLQAHAIQTLKPDTLSHFFKQSLHKNQQSQQVSV